MSNRYSVGQMNQLGDGLEAADYSVDEVTKLRNPDLLMPIKLVLAGVATIVRHCLKLALDEPFNPTDFIGDEWTIWRGSADGNGLEGEEDCVTEPDIVSFEQIVMETYPQGRETSVHGEEKMKRARASKNRQMGGRAFLALWNNWLVCKAVGKPKDSILEKLRKSIKIGNVVYLLGFTLRSPNGDRCVLRFYFSGREWLWGYTLLDSYWHANSPSAALESVEAQSRML